MKSATSMARRTDPMPSIELPKHEILEGTPNAQIMFTATSEDNMASAGFWSCDVGRYEFVFDYDEFIYLIEGSVTVTQTNPPGDSFTLSPGDTAHFPQGTTSIWKVDRKMTKYFVAREPF